LPVSRPLPPDPGSRQGLHLYTLLIDEKASPVSRDEFVSELHRRNIGTGVHYRAIPVHPVYQRLFGWAPSDYPVADAIGRTTVSLPLSAKLTAEDAEDVIHAVHEVLRRATH
jgi:dTDP-4-amino-4,6-dideoxygalactose transaminase